MRRRLPLAAIAAAAALPIMLFAAGVVVHVDRQQQKMVGVDLRQAAHAAIEAVELQIGNCWAALTALAASPAIDAGDLDAFRAHLERVVGAHPTWLSARLTDATTRVPLVVMSAEPPPFDEQLLDAAAASGSPQIGNLKTEPADGARRYVMMVVPVNRGGRLTHFLSASIDVASYSAILQSQTFDEDSTVAVLDRNRVIVARNRAPESFIGTLATPSLRSEMDRFNEHLFFALNKEGDRVYTAFVTSPQSGWTAAVGVPAAVIEAPLRRSLLALAGGGGGALALSLVLATAIIRNVDRRQRAERRLLELESQRSVERRLADIAANVPGVVYRRIMHPDGTIAHPYVSGGMSHLLGTAVEEIKQATSLDAFGRRFLAPEDRARWHQSVTAAAEAMRPYHLEVRLTVDPDRVFWVHSTAVPHRRADRTIVWDGVALDITELKQAEGRLAASLAEKEALLREIHHRVRNNLQVISSLLQLELQHFADSSARERIGRISQRIAVLGRIHDQLYASENFARIDVGRHIEQLCDSLGEIHAAGTVRMTRDIEQLYCDLDTAIPLGLIANELITNGLKHGAAAGRPAAVRVTFSKEGDSGPVTLAVENDAVDTPADPTASGGLGMRIVQALVSQLGAELAVAHSDGWRVTLTVPGDRLTR